MKAQTHIEFDPDTQFEVTHDLPHEHKDGTKHIHVGFVFPQNEVIFCFDIEGFADFTNKINTALVQAHFLIAMEMGGFTEAKEPKNIRDLRGFLYGNI